MLEEKGKKRYQIYVRKAKISGKRVEQLNISRLQGREKKYKGEILECRIVAEHT